MKKSFRLFLVFSLSIFGMLPGVVNACHLGAADIYVTYIGANADGCSSPEYKYQINVTIYYACQTCFSNGNGNQTITVKSNSLNVTLPNVQAVPVDANSTIVHSLCGQFSDSNSCIPYSTNPNQPNPFRAANFPGFQKREYSVQVTLPGPAPDWTFSWSSGVRNLGTNTVGTPNLYIEAGLNNVTKYANSTPRFNSNPLPYICVNQPTTYLNTPFDPNGDSVVVINQTPYTGPAAQHTYAAGYSNTDPVGSAPSNPYNLNPFTGAATFTPQTQGFYIFGFRATDYEYGTGIELSYVYRDVQVAVLPCNAPPPVIDTLSQTKTEVNNAKIIKSKTLGEAVFVCPGSNMDISLTTQASSPGGKIYMSANTDIFTGSTFSAPGNGSDNVKGTFNWTPAPGDVGFHTLVITSKDSTCLISQPIVLVSYRVILVNVTPGLDAGPDVKVCEFNPQPVPLYVYGAEDITVKWTLDGGPAIGISNDAIRNPTVTIGRKVEYVVSSPDLVGNCKSSDSVGTIIDPGDGVLITPHHPVDRSLPFVMCRPGYLQMDAFPLGRGRKDNINCGPITPIECTEEDTATIYGSMQYREAFYDTLSKEAFDLDNKIRTSKLQYIINRDEIKKADMWSSSISGMSLYVNAGDNQNYEYGNVKLLIKCTDKTELVKEDGYEDPATMTEVFTSATYFFTDGAHYFPFSSHYNWDTTKNVIVQLLYSNNKYVDTCGASNKPPFFRFSSTTYASSFQIKPGPSFTNPNVPDSTVLDLTATLQDNKIQAFKTRPVTTFTYCEVPGLPFELNWFYGDQLSDTTGSSTLAYVPKSSYYVAQTIGRSGCITRDTLHVYVPEHDFRVTPDDTAICLGDAAPLLVYGGHFFKWYEYENGTYVDPVSVRAPKSNYTFIQPQKTTEYRIVVSDSVFCYDTLTAHVRVLPLPDVRILNEDDTTIKYGQQIQLLASGARFYNWSPVASLNNPNISYPIGRPMEDTKYIVGGIGANGCRAFDTLHVIIDKRDNLFVPSAFSPNGDGRNDLFRVTNLSFQRIMEFRVFNRWGQEVYSTNDSRAGWDGTWGGVPQDMGTYTYLIRVAYPDGFVETYRGETTLIR